LHGLLPERPVECVPGFVPDVPRYVVAGGQDVEAIGCGPLPFGRDDLIVCLLPGVVVEIDVVGVEIETARQRVDSSQLYLGSQVRIGL
jgi:hypothetical protein